MKKLWNVLLVMVLVLSMTACGANSDKHDEDDSEDSNKVTATATPGENEGDDDQGDSEGGENGGESEDKEPTPTPEEEKVSPTPTEKPKVEGLDTSGEIEETVLVDNNDVKITATGLEYSKRYVNINIQIENNSDEELDFGTYVAVNGYMMDGAYLYETVAAGKKAKADIEIDVSELQMYGLSQVADIVVGITATDEDYDKIRFGETQIKTSLADGYDYSKKYYQDGVQSGVLASVADCEVEFINVQDFFSQEDVRIVSQTYAINSDDEGVLLVEVVNESDETIYSVTQGVVVDKMVGCAGTWDNGLVVPGATRIMTINVADVFYGEPMELFGIEEVGEVTYSFAVMDEEYDEIVEPETICVKVSDASTELDTTGVVVYEDNDIRIISKGLREDESEYSDDLHWWLMIENMRDEEISVDEVYNTFALNGYMTDCLVWSCNVPAGCYAMLDVEMYESYLEECDISAIENIKEAEIGLEIQTATYKDIDETTVKVTFSTNAPVAIATSTPTPMPTATNTPIPTQKPTSTNTPTPIKTSKYEYAFIRDMSNYDLFYMFDSDTKEVVYFSSDSDYVDEGTYTGSFASGVTINWNHGQWSEKFVYKGNGEEAIMTDGNGFEWEYELYSVDKAQKVLDQYR